MFSHCTTAQWIAVGVVTVYHLGIEYWLGKTQKVQASSQVEVVVNMALALWRALKKEK